MRGASGPFGSSGSVGSSGSSGAGVRSGTMSALLSCLFIVSASALLPHDDEVFRYHVHLGREESCAMCFAADCWTLQSQRCRYYADASERGGAGSGADSGVDSGADSGASSGSGLIFDMLMHNMMTQAAASWMTQECIPFVSEHSDCDKENICVGCTRCSCDASGRWRCAAVQRCTDEPELVVDHRVLVSVAEALKSVNNRKKKSVSYADLAEWMYGAKSIFDVKANDTVSDNIANFKQDPFDTKSEQIQITTPLISNVREGYIEFDEALSKVAIDNQTYKRHKPPQTENRQFNDYLNIELEVPKSDNGRFSKMTNDDDTELTFYELINESTKMAIDLLNGSADTREKSSVSDKAKLISNIINRENYPDDTNETISLNVINVMKRDTSSVLQLNTTTEATTEINDTTTIVPELKKDVLVPLNKIIIDKEQELKDLLKIKENLIRFITDYNETIDSNTQEKLNNSNSISIYNLDIYPEIQVNLRKINPNIMDKLLYKLKRDIYEVIRDVVGIRKIAATKTLPNDLKTLIHAMSVFVRKQGNMTNIKENNISLNNLFRRHMNSEESIHMNSTNYYLIKILDILDKSLLPKTEALAPLLPNTRTIIKRVIKNTYVGDLPSFGLIMYGPDYNLTNDLENIGTTWQHLTANFENSEPANKIYAMKLLHLTLSAEINKLNDALAVINIAYSRRMIPIEGSLESVLNKINDGLTSIHDKIKVIILHKKFQKLSEESTNSNPSSRKSFLRKIRNLLKGSKAEIKQLSNKNIPRSQIVKTVARKRLDELAKKKLAEYSQTMRKWQNAFNIIPRNKRSLGGNRVINRMNHIIPNYLRGKLDPAIFTKKTKEKMNKESTNSNIERLDKQIKATPKPHMNVKGTRARKRSHTVKRVVTTPRYKKKTVPNM